MEAEKTGQDVVPVQGMEVKRELFGRGRLKLMLSILVLELAIFSTALLIPIDAATVVYLQDQGNTISTAAANPNSFDAFWFIFTTNARTSLLEFFPIVGSLVWIVVTYTTGEVIQAIAVSQGFPGIVAGYVLFLFPYAIVELSAYAVAVGSSIMLLVAWRRKSLRLEAKVLILEVLVVLGMLGAAAAMETVTIISPPLGFALWVPTIVALVAIVHRLRQPSL